MCVGTARGSNAAQVTFERQMHGLMERGESIFLRIMNVNCMEKYVRKQLYVVDVSMNCECELYGKICETTF